MVSDESAITQPDELLSWQGPETGQTDGARGYLRVEKFCSVPPFAGMNASGASEYHYWEMVGADHFMFLLTWLVVCFRPHWCKVRETLNKDKAVAFGSSCSFCLHQLWIYLGVSYRSRTLGPAISEVHSDGYEHEMDLWRAQWSSKWKKMLARILKRGHGYNRALWHETFNFL